MSTDLGVRDTDSGSQELNVEDNSSAVQESVEWIVSRKCVDREKNLL